MEKSNFQDIIVINIDVLNDDCLMHIFEFLNKKEKLRIERVSRRWKRVSEQSWSKIKFLNINPNHKFKINDKFFCSNKKNMYTNYLVKILKLSSSYLNDLTIKLSEGRNYLNCDRLVTNVLQSCKNVTRLSLKDDGFHNIFTEEYLSKLFESALNLSSISMKGIIVDGSCFMKLASKNIRELSFYWCTFESDIFYSKFLLTLKNLNYFRIENEVNILEKISLALYDSNCKNLNEICISICEYQSLSSSYTLKLIRKQKN